VSADVALLQDRARPDRARRDDDDLGLDAEGLAVRAGDGLDGIGVTVAAADALHGGVREDPRALFFGPLDVGRQRPLLEVVDAADVAEAAPHAVAERLLHPTRLESDRARALDEELRALRDVRHPGRHGAERGLDLVVRCRETVPIELGA